MDTVTVNGTSYLFEDKDLFHHRYTFVITGDNEEQGKDYVAISSAASFTYQRGILHVHTQYLLYL